MLSAIMLTSLHQHGRHWYTYMTWFDPLFLEILRKNFQSTVNVNFSHLNKLRVYGTHLTSIWLISVKKPTLSFTNPLGMCVICLMAHNTIVCILVKRWACPRKASNTYHIPTQSTQKRRHYCLTKCSLTNCPV